LGGPTEAELNAWMERLADGDRDAFTPLFASLHPRVLAIAQRRLGAADAADAAQRALVAVFARASEFERGRPFLPWFWAIVANEVHGVARRRRLELVRETGLEAAAHETSEGDPETAMAEAEMRENLRRAIDELDPLSATAIRAHLDEMSLASPSTAFTSPAALRKRISRAYARLRLLLGGNT
jgi:RNA polymerase sigma-70 factor (ECF subfamily)